MRSDRGMHPAGQSSDESKNDASERWPALPYAEWRETCQTLHLWTQIVGKVRLALSPPLNHGWATTLYVTPRGLTTLSIPNGTRAFEVAFVKLPRIGRQ